MDKESLRYLDEKLTRFGVKQTQFVVDPPNRRCCHTDQDTYCSACDAADAETPRRGLKQVKLSKSEGPLGTIALGEGLSALSSGREGVDAGAHRSAAHSPTLTAEVRNRNLRDSQGRPGPSLVLPAGGGPHATLPLIVGGAARPAVDSLCSGTGVRVNPLNAVILKSVQYIVM
ncbi:hypothetical protein H920_04896 [Fukomys damarensis]|uniref:Uncharacterized protein n=1 Tax=Fukomys damarensis TaxID=885580 RepID=A0A091DNM6_FUKDA|nr:hypothetical protein H920_04896 [Fukomys damarensis]